MTDWRDDVTEQTRDEIDSLLSTSLEIAETRLNDGAELAPYGVAVTVEGEGELLVPAPEQVPAEADAGTVVGLCREVVASRGEALTSAAVVAAVDLQDGRDGVRVELAHRDGVALTVIAPCVRNDGAVTFGELSATAGAVTGLRTGGAATGGVDRPPRDL